LYETPVLPHIVASLSKRPVPIPVATEIGDHQRHYISPTALNAFQKSKPERTLTPSNRRGGHETSHIHRTHRRRGSIAIYSAGAASCQGGGADFRLEARRAHTTPAGCGGLIGVTPLTLYRDCATARNCGIAL